MNVNAWIMDLPDNNPINSAAAAGRQPTADPDRFVIPLDQVPAGLAARVDDHPSDPVRARPAATVVLMRPADHGPEALLLRRPTRSSFAAGAWVFPGGRVDAADSDASLSEYWDGPSPAVWRERLGLTSDSEAIAYIAATVREAWEETGILLGADCSSPGESLDRARLDILNHNTSLREVFEREGLRISAGDILYIAHWITPEAEPRRYDTRFFLARVDADTACVLHGDELVEATWMRPSDAVERYSAGRMKLLPPTVHTLNRLAGFTSLEEIWSSLSDAQVTTILPRMRRSEEGVVVELEEVSDVPDGS
ncbi:MAG TPA: hypothetical protein VFI91_05260 [Longimicrobiaceae bacterium]|nr:hypothetical protein [Longimicrobiaceae bacterium]